MNRQQGRRAPATQPCRARSPPHGRRCAPTTSNGRPHARPPAQPAPSARHRPRTRVGLSFGRMKTTKSRTSRTRRRRPRTSRRPRTRPTGRARCAPAAAPPPPPLALRKSALLPLLPSSRAPRPRRLGWPRAEAHGALVLGGGRAARPGRHPHRAAVQPDRPQRREGVPRLWAPLHGPQGERRAPRVLCPCPRDKLRRHLPAFTTRRPPCTPRCPAYTPPCLRARPPHASNHWPSPPPHTLGSCPSSRSLYSVLWLLFIVV